MGSLSDTVENHIKFNFNFLILALVFLTDDNINKVLKC